MATKMVSGFALTAIILLALGASAEEIDNPQILANNNLTTRALATRPKNGYPRDCSGVKGKSGIYVIQPSRCPPIVVYCDMTTDGGGWTVIQRNYKPSQITWAEFWTAYKYGFGNILREYWLGNEYIFKIISQGSYKIKFLLRNARNVQRFADYDSFSIADEKQGYQLNLGRYRGNAGNAMMGYGNNLMHDNMKFSTFDRDQDRWSSNCAKSCRGGFWFNRCYRVNLNVKNGIYWYPFCTGSCRFSQIMIKRNNVCRRIYRG
ncbi:fibrinogen-like protein 1-like protein [Heptranchias perlo]|uniref:fibrinogen-like protein 1-like protein n=1 Tax=Heptranchias perlo TaxID=212740 RepID=UPI003559F60B